MFSVPQPKGKRPKADTCVMPSENREKSMSFSKVAPLVKPAPKRELHKKPVPRKPAAKKPQPKPRPIGDRD
jgi:hypothetical protein